MLRNFSIVPLLTVAAMWVGCAPGPVASLEMITHDGLQRTYRIFVPADSATSGPLPLVVVLHGGQGSSDQIEQFTSFTPLAAEVGFAVVYPDGVQNEWNDGRETRFGTTEPLDTDDVGFLLAMLEQVAQNYPIDPDAIFLTGASNGGMMTFRMACEVPGVFAAIAPVMSSLIDELVTLCDDGPPVPMMLIHGTNDRFVPYGGGPLLGNEEYGRAIGVPDTMALWSARNGCEGEPVVTALPNLSAFDRTQTFVEEYACSAAPLVHVRVENGGHTWPGGPRLQPLWLLGPVSGDFDATGAIWTFFDQNRQPSE
jgi:polyhydroxybutyrate depolymerase